MDIKNILPVIKEGKDYDFIANNYHAMSKSDLADLYKELTYSVYTFLPEKEYKKFLEHFHQTCEERFND